MEIRVAAFQMAVGRDVSENARKIVNAIDRACDDGAEILLTPEGSLSGYTHEFDPSDVDAELTRVTEHAHKRRIGLALGTCFVEDDRKCYNQIRFYRPDATYLGFHAKTLRCGDPDGRPGGEVEHFAAADLRTFRWRDGVRVGGLICNDLWANPEYTPMPDSHLSQRLSAMGAQVIFHAVNGGRDATAWTELTYQFHEANLRLRARAGNIWVVTVDSAAPIELPCSAPSGIISPAGTFECRLQRQGEQYFAYTIQLGGSPQ